MKKDAYYFSHDSNAKDDPKCVLLIEQLGLEGYGIYWVLVETLREQPEYRYPINLLTALARRYNTTFEKMKAVVFSYDLFNVENDSFFFSYSLIERMKELEEKRAKRSNAGKKGNELRWNNYKLIANVSQCDNNAITMQSQCIANKVKESKVKESKDINIDFVSIDFKESFNKWLEYKKQRKETYKSELSIKSCYNKLLKLSNNNPKIAIEIIEQSIANNWAGLFELKENNSDIKNIAIEELRIIYKSLKDAYDREKCHQLATILELTKVLKTKKINCDIEYFKNCIYGGQNSMEDWFTDLKDFMLKRDTENNTIKGILYEYKKRFE